MARRVEPSDPNYRMMKRAVSDGIVDAVKRIAWFVILMAVLIVCVSMSVVLWIWQSGAFAPA